MITDAAGVEESLLLNCSREAINDSNSKSLLIKKGHKWFFTSIKKEKYGHKNEYYSSIQKKMHYDILKSSRKDADRISKESLYAIKTNTVFPIKSCFLPGSLFRITWDIVIIISVIVYSFTLPYSIITIDDLSKFITSINIIIDLLFIADIYVSFNQGFYEKRCLMMDKRKIMMKYMKSWFIWDFLGSFPVSIITQVYLGKGLNNLDFIGGSDRFRNSRLIKFLHILKYLNVFRLSKLLYNYNMVGHSFTKKVIISMYRMNVIIIILFVKYFIMILLFSHFASSFVFVTTYFSDNDRSDSFMKTYQLTDESPANIYITYLFFYITTISTTGYGNYVPKNTFEKFVVIANLGLFGAIFSTLIGSITIIFQYQYFFDAFERSKVTYFLNMTTDLQETTKKKIKKELLQNLRIKENKLSNSEVLNFYLGKDVFERMILYLNLDIVNLIPIINSNEFVCLSLAKLLKEKSYVSDEHIVYEDKPCRKIFCLLKGKIKFYTQKRKNFKLVLDKTYSMIGHTEFASNRKTWIYSVKSQTNSDFVYVTYLSIYKVAEELYDRDPLVYKHFINELKTTREHIKLTNNYQKVGISCHFCGNYDHNDFNCSIPDFN